MVDNRRTKLKKMFVSEGVQTSAHLEKKLFERHMVQEGIRAWKEQQEGSRIRKIQEQQRMRDMMSRCWPWGQQTDNRPRGLRNLRLEGLFPNQDFQKAKRYVGGLELGRPGGGAPNVNDGGKKLCRTKEDPLLRFQKDLRQCVDNALRYRMNRKEKEEYKKELDKLVEEKFKQKEKEHRENLAKERELLLISPPWGKPGPGGKLWRHHKDIGLNFFKSLGYTNGGTLGNRKDRTKKADDFKRTTLKPPNQIVRHDKIMYPRRDVFDYMSRGPNQAILRGTRLSPLHHGKDNGIELVPLMLEKRSTLKIPLGTTDVTRQGYINSISKSSSDGQGYLQELSQQMQHKMHCLKESRLREIDGARKHFTTLDTFWGRPGHGAPRSGIKKGSIEKMLFPKIIPMAA